MLKNIYLLTFIKYIIRYHSKAQNRNKYSANSAIFIIHFLLVRNYITSCTTECNRIQENNGGRNGQVRKKTTTDLVTDYTLHVYCTNI